MSRLRLALALFLCAACSAHSPLRSASLPVINLPSDDADVIKIPATFPDTLIVCVQTPFSPANLSWHCTTLGELRVLLPTRRTL